MKKLEYDIRYEFLVSISYNIPEIHRLYNFEMYETKYKLDKKYGKFFNQLKDYHNNTNGKYCYEWLMNNAYNYNLKEIEFSQDSVYSYYSCTDKDFNLDIDKLKLTKRFSDIFISKVNEFNKLLVSYWKIYKDDFISYFNKYKIYNEQSKSYDDTIFDKIKIYFHEHRDNPEVKVSTTGSYGFLDRIIVEAGFGGGDIGMLIHEFMHGYINPIIYDDDELYKSFPYKVKWDKTRGEADAYGSDKKIIVVEYFVRAFTIFIEYKQFNKTSDLFKWDIISGFLDIEQLFTLILNTYDKSKFKSLKSYIIWLSKNNNITLNESTNKQDFKSLDDYIKWYYDPVNHLEYKSGHDNKYWHSKSLEEVIETKEANCYELAMYHVYQLRKLQAKKLIHGYNIFLIAIIDNEDNHYPNNSYHILIVVHYDKGFNTIPGIHRNKKNTKTELLTIDNRLEDGSIACKLKESDLRKGMSMIDIYNLHKKREVALNKSSYKQLNESYIFSDDDILYNLDEWKKEKNKNILYVTGLSGSGKTTFAKQMASKHNAVTFHIDMVVRILNNKPLKDGDYLPFENELRKFYGNVEYGGYNTPEFIPNLNRLMSKAINLISDNYKTLYVLEGTWLLNLYDPEYFDDKPVIIKGTSLITSIYRRLSRDGIKPLKNISGLIHYYKRDNASVDEWIKHYSNKLKDKKMDNLTESYNNNKYFRFTYENIGIYEAYKKNCTHEEWIKFLSNPNIQWLPKPPEYGKFAESYFTKEGRDIFIKKTLPIIIKVLNPFKCIEHGFVDIEGEITYEDKYQVVISHEKHINESGAVPEDEIKYNAEDLKPHHAIAGVIFNNKKEILIQYHNKFGFLTMPVGKVKPNQSIYDGLCMELREETSIHVQEAKELFAYRKQYERQGHVIDATTHIFEIIKYTGYPKNNEPLKHKYIKWFSINELFKLSRDDISDALFSYLEYYKKHNTVADMILDDDMDLKLNEEFYEGEINDINNAKQFISENNKEFAPNIDAAYRKYNQPDNESYIKQVIDKMLSDRYGIKMSSFLLHEDIFIKHPKLIEAEKLLENIRDELLSDIRFNPNLTNYNFSLEKCLEDVFNLESIMIEWKMSPESLAVYTVPILPASVLTWKNDITDDQFEVIKSKNSLQFKDKKNKVLFVSLVTALFTRFNMSPQDVLAIILHEIGHNFYVFEFELTKKIFMLSMLDFFNLHEKAITTGKLINMDKRKEEITGYKKLEVDNNKNIMVKEKIRARQSIAGVNQNKSIIVNKIISAMVFPVKVGVLYFKFFRLIKLIFGGINVINPWHNKAFRDERFSDNFVTMHGYGQYLASSLNKLSSSRGSSVVSNAITSTPIIGGLYNSVKNIYDFINNFILFNDVHPYEDTRMEDQVKYLQYELNKTTYKRMKELISQEIKDIEEIRNKFNDFKTNYRYDKDFIGAVFKSIWRKISDKSPLTTGEVVNKSEYSYTDNLKRK